MSDEFKPLLARLADGATLVGEDAESFFSACLRGEPTPAQIAAAVTAMRLRGETVGEITACARALRREAMILDHPFEVIDVCGTGGDGAHTLNISTAVAFVAAGAGLKVAKHGTRAVSSKSGSSDVLAALGVNLEASPDQNRRALAEAGVCFLFAPAHHRALRHVMPVREQLGFRTIFNILGPLSNPANAQASGAGSLLGAVGRTAGARPRSAGRHPGLGGARRRPGRDHHDRERLRSRNGGTVGCDFSTLRQKRWALSRAALADLRGGDPAAQRRRATGSAAWRAPGAYRDVVLLNAAAALLVAERAETLREGVGTRREKPSTAGPRRARSMS